MRRRLSQSPQRPRGLLSGGPPSGRGARSKRQGERRRDARRHRIRLLFQSKFGKTTTLQDLHSEEVPPAMQPLRPASDTARRSAGRAREDHFDTVRHQGSCSTHAWSAGSCQAEAMCALQHRDARGSRPSGAAGIARALQHPVTLHVKCPPKTSAGKEAMPLAKGTQRTDKKYTEKSHICPWPGTSTTSRK